MPPAIESYQSGGEERQQLVEIGREAKNLNANDVSTLRAYLTKSLTELDKAHAQAIKQVLEKDDGELRRIVETSRDAMQLLFNKLSQTVDKANTEFSNLVQQWGQQLQTFEKTLSSVETNADENIKIETIRTKIEQATVMEVFLNLPPWSGVTKEEWGEKVSSALGISHTAESVMKLQAALGLPEQYQDGIIGPQTVYRLLPNGQKDGFENTYKGYLTRRHEISGVVDEPVTTSKAAKVEKTEGRSLEEIIRNVNSSAWAEVSGLSYKMWGVCQGSKVYLKSGEIFWEYDKSYLDTAHPIKRYGDPLSPTYTRVYSDVRMTFETRNIKKNEWYKVVPDDQYNRFNSSIEWALTNDNIVYANLGAGKYNRIYLNADGSTNSTIITENDLPNALNRTYQAELVLQQDQFVVEFQDGTISTNPFFRFRNGGWEVSTSAKSDFYPVSGALAAIHSFGSVSERAVRALQSVDTVTDGLKLLQSYRHEGCALVMAAGSTGQVARYLSGPMEWRSR